MKKTLVGTNENGSPHYAYVAEEGERVVITGPIVAQLTMEDGTVYDVSDPVIAVEDKHHDELVDAIGDHYEAAGHPHMTDPSVPFVHDRENGVTARSGKKPGSKHSSTTKED